MEQKNNLLIPASIIIAGFLVAGGIYLSDRGSSPTTPKSVNQQVVKASDIKIDPISKDEHILGDPNAPIAIVEFSDTECPFCKVFHTTMKSVIDKYGKDGKVAWVYRHFPIDGLHPKAKNEARSTECVNELGGSIAFWKYLDTMYENTPSNNGLAEARLPEFAKIAGVNVTDFNLCLASTKYLSEVEDSVEAAQVAGANGTPFSVFILKSPMTSLQKDNLNQYIINTSLFDRSGNPIVYPSSDGLKIAMSGALTADMVKSIIEILLK